MVNPNNTIAELRLDWSTTYIYSGPPYVWSAGGAVTRTTEITDPNNNFETCIVGGNSGGSTPAWPPLHAAAGTITSDGGVVKWEVINTPAPGIMAVNLSGTVNNFSAVAGQESFSLSGLPVTAANTARLQLGGNFITFGIPGSLESFVDTSLWNGTPQYLAGYQNAGTFFATTQTGIVPAQQLMYNNDQITVSGYLDVFVDPGSIQVQIAAPVQLGITTYSNSPVVLFPTPPGTNYVLQMSTNLTTDNWVTVTNGVPFTGIEITNPPSPAFFRLY
ncbi:MAG TPA: hypothetical protein VKU37_02810 [Verrucomicrobiae bacterium]|nr:hypothetical protein [Verrucomicrobiae bacterium]